MLYLPSVRLALCVVLFTGTLEAQNRNITECRNNLQPVFSSVKYHATIDVLKKHLSGILVFKKMEDDAVRVVFINEIGSTFFDFTFLENSYFVNSMMPALKKKAVIKTLAKDLGMILMRSVFKPIKSDDQYSGNKMTLKLKKKGSVIYYVNNTCNTIDSIENTGRKKVVSIYPTGYSNHNLPDSIFVQHHTVNFTISLKQLHASE